MTNTPDIETLVAKLRDDDLVCSWQATTKAMLEKAADALERQQAVVEAARAYVKGSLYDSTALCKALAALDAKPDGDG